MSILFPLTGGLLTDMPPVATEPFVYYAENLRWRLGLPETVGLIARMRDQNGDPVQIPFRAAHNLSAFADQDKVLFASARDLFILDYDTGDVTTINIPDIGSNGNWWFAPTEDSVIVGRNSKDGKPHVLDRETLTVSKLAGAPTGSVAGGIVNGVLMLMGTTSFGSNPQALTVRWSARRTDPSGGGGKYGFEDWTPSDINASGEIPLDDASKIMGGGTSSQGAIVWTDRSTHLFLPRTDLYTFSEERVYDRGLLSNQCWTVGDGRVWWYDPTLTLHVLDGQGARPIPCPCRMASVEALDWDYLAHTFLTHNAHYGEIIFCFRAQNNCYRNLVYNYLEDVWYIWNIDRRVYLDRTGKRPTLGLDRNGYVYMHDLFKTVDGYFIGAWDRKLYQGNDHGLEVEADVDIVPHHFILTTSVLPGDFQSIRGLRGTLSHTYARRPLQALAGPGFVPVADQICVTLLSHDTPAQDAPLVHYDMQMMPVGSHGADFRAGGRALRAALRGSNLTTMIRFGSLQFDPAQGGRR